MFAHEQGTGNNRIQCKPSKEWIRLEMSARSAVPLSTWNWRYSVARYFLKNSKKETNSKKWTSDCSHWWLTTSACTWPPLVCGNKIRRRKFVNNRENISRHLHYLVAPSISLPNKKEFSLQQRSPSLREMCLESMFRDSESFMSTELCSLNQFAVSFNLLLSFVKPWELEGIFRIAKQARRELLLVFFLSDFYSIACSFVQVFFWGIEFEAVVCFVWSKNQFTLAWV